MPGLNQDIVLHAYTSKTLFKVLPYELFLWLKEIVIISSMSCTWIGMSQMIVVSQSCKSMPKIAYTARYGIYLLFELTRMVDAIALCAVGLAICGWAIIELLNQTGSFPCPKVFEDRFKSCWPVRLISIIYESNYSKSFSDQTSTRILVRFLWVFIISFNDT